MDFKVEPGNPFKATFRSKHGYMFGIELVNEEVDTRLNLAELASQGTYSHFKKQFGKLVRKIGSENVSWHIFT